MHAESKCTQLVASYRESRLSFNFLGFGSKDAGGGGCMALLQMVGLSVARCAGVHMQAPCMYPGMHGYLPALIATQDRAPPAASHSSGLLSGAKV